MAGTQQFNIVNLNCSDNFGWYNFLRDIRATLELPESCALRLTLAGLDAEVSAPDQLQNDDRVLVYVY